MQLARALLRRVHALVSATGLGKDDRELISIVSFPKSGRTWLRQMLCHYTHCSIDLKPGRPDRLPRKILPADTNLPGILFLHEDNPLHKTPDDLNRDKSAYRGKRVIFLARDPRDVVVSAYFEWTKRIQLYKPKDEIYKGTIDHYVYEETGSLKTIIEYYNIWYENRSVPEMFLLLKYEDMQKDTASQMRRVLEFSGYPVDALGIAEAVESGKFERMHAAEREADAGYRLRPGDKSDPESFKTRRGIVGGYTDYLADTEIEFLNQYITEKLNCSFGYNAAPNKPR